MQTVTLTLSIDFDGKAAADVADDLDAGLILVPIGMIALAFILGWVDKSLDGW